MSSKPLQRIKSLLDSLPIRDIPLGYKFYEERDFESLRDLVDSALIRTRRNIATSKSIEYLSVNLDNLRTLKSEVDFYLEGLMIENPEGDSELYKELMEYL